VENTGSPGEGGGDAEAPGAEGNSPGSRGHSPLLDADLGGQGRPGQTEEGRVEPTLSAALPEGLRGKGLANPEAPTREGGSDAPWGSSPTSVIQRGGLDLFWMTRQRPTSGRVWTRADVPATRPLTECLSS